MAEISTSKTLLQVNDLRVTLPTARGWAQALRGVSLRMERGQTVGLIGESGCGKSLTALALMGLLPEQALLSGSILWEGQELVGMPEPQWCQLRGARMAMIFQEPMTALNPLHPIWKQIAEPLRLHQHMGAAEAKARALQLLDRVQLPRARERLDAYPHELSGGQRQRVMISMALACSPDLLIADEPTTALDVTVQKEVLALIKQLVDEDGMGLLLISHDLGLMQDQVDRVMVMYGGSVVESAATPELFAQRAHPYTRGLFAARPRWGLARGTRLTTMAGSVPELMDLPPGCAFADRCPWAVDDCRHTPPAANIVATQSRSTEPHVVHCPRWSLS